MIIDAFRASSPAIPAGRTPRPAAPIPGEVGLVPTPRPPTVPRPRPRRVSRPERDDRREARTDIDPTRTDRHQATRPAPPATTSIDAPPPTWRRVVSALFTVAVVALVMFLWPARLGGSTRLVIVSGDSMEPTYDFGDLVVTRDHGTAKAGDIVVFAVPDGEAKGILVIHRVTHVDENGIYHTQGDNRDTPDSWDLTDDDIVGRPLVPIPKGGYVVWYLQQWWVVAILVGLVALFLLWPDQDDEEVEHAALHADDGDEALDARVATPEAVEDEPPEPEHVPVRVPEPVAEPLVTSASVTPAFFDDDELRIDDPTDDTTTMDAAAMSFDAWSERPIDPAVMDEAVAWLDAQLEQLSTTSAGSAV